VKESRRLLQHFLAALAYRTQKALREAPDEIIRFHDLLAGLHADFADESLIARISDEQFLQGPLADAMTHAGQLALLRRLAGSPVASEDFIEAAIDASNVSARQPLPVAPDDWWRPDQPPQPPGPRRMTGTNRIQ